MASGRFAELITQLAEEHSLVVNNVRSQYEQRLNSLTQQVTDLTAQLSKAGISPSLIHIETADEDAGHIPPAPGMEFTGGSVIACADVRLVHDGDENGASAVRCIDLDAPESGAHALSRITHLHGRRILSARQASGVKAENANDEGHSDMQLDEDSDYKSANGFDRDSKREGRGEFHLRASWNKHVEDTTGTSTIEVTSYMRKQSVDPLKIASSSGFKQFHMQFRFPTTLSALVISPNGTFRMGWDMAGMLLIGYDCLMIPFTQAFEPEASPFLKGMDAFLLYFWTFDMIQAFNLGYYSKGRYVDEHRKILLNYLKTWFLIDLIVVGPEWMQLIFRSGDMLGGLGRMLKGARAIRVLRLLRLLKLQRIINMLYDMLESEYTFIALNLVKLLLSVAVLNHVIACAWYGIGRLCSIHDVRNWIDVGRVTHEELVYRYTTSLHWSLTQFTPASMDISARNVFERIFSILVLFFAMVAFSSIVASITGAMTSLRNLKNDQNKQFWLLRRYLRQRNITSNLSGRIVKFLEYQLEKQSTVVQLSSIKIMGGLSEELQRELAHQMHSPFLTVHPFFNFLEGNMQIMLQRLCFQCLRLQLYAEGEVVFNMGDEAINMFFIKSGALQYLYASGKVLDPAPSLKETVSEGVLWTDWRHRGRLAAICASDLILLSPGKFTEVMSMHPKPWYFSKHYATRFVEKLNNTEPYLILDFLRGDDEYTEEVMELIADESKNMYRAPTLATLPNESSSTRANPRDA